VGWRVESSLLELVERGDIGKAELANNHLENFLNSRISVMKDIANNPLVTTGVLGTNISSANLFDYLDGYRILGKREIVVIHDVVGDVVYSNEGHFPQSDERIDWFSAIIDEDSSFNIRISTSNGESNFIISVPVNYGRGVQGVLSVSFQESLESLLSSVLTSTSAIDLESNYSHYSSVVAGKNYTLVSSDNVGMTGFTLKYFVDSEIIKEEKFNFMLDVTISIVSVFCLSFLFLAVFGRRFILNPYLHLEKSQMETQIEKEKSDLLVQAVEASTVGISISSRVDEDFEVTYLNGAFSKITGYFQEEFIGKNCRILQGDDTDISVVSKISEAIKNREKVRVEIINYKKNGDKFWNDLRLSPVFDKDRELVAYVGVLQDISHHKSSHLALMQARDDARAAVVAKSEFLANMSHEIRTPMNGVLGMLDLVLKTNLNPEQKRRLEVAQHSAKSLLSLINDILDFSKIEAEKLELEQIEFNPRDLIDELGEVMALAAEDQEVELIIDLVGIDVTEVIGDPIRIRQVLTNLLCNAIKFTSHGEVIVRAQLQRQRDTTGYLLLCSIIDTGIGISEDDLGNLFNAFNQVDASTTRKYGGTGLGLSIAKKLCELMGGDLHVSSKMGEGSTFSFAIPVAVHDCSLVVKSNAAIADFNILIVDSNLTSTDVLRRQIECWGATVATASNGQDAQAICEKNHASNGRFDAAFIAMNVSEPDGYELGFNLKNDERFSSVSLFLMTSMGYQADALAISRAGFSSYFPKPVTTANLLNAFSIVGNEDAKCNSEPEPSSEQYLEQGSSVISQSDLDQVKILLVEDNEINRMVIEGIIEGFGLAIESVNNGKEALDIMNEQADSAPYTLILMDCQMPVMDGYSATKAIRAGAVGDRYSNIPIIAITANAMDGDQEACTSAGMNDYVVKPVDGHLLLDKIRQWRAIDGGNLTEHNGTDVIVDNNCDIWDFDSVLARVGGRDSVVKKLVALYVGDVDEMFSAMKVAFESEDHVALLAILHSLKGVAGNLSANALADAVLELESAVKESNINQYEALLSVVQQCNRKLLEVFSRYLAE
jgi:PAS domain S-box-containing protein